MVTIATTSSGQPELQMKQMSEALKTRAYAAFRADPEIVRSRTLMMAVLLSRIADSLDRIASVVVDDPEAIDKNQCLPADSSREMSETDVSVAFDPAMLETFLEFLRNIAHKA